MKFTVAAVAALAAGAQASYAASNVTYTTEVVTAYTTFCPVATELTYGGKTYTVTEATTLTISDCPCTVSKPVYTTSSVVCSTCTTSSSEAPVYPTTYANSTVATSTTVKATGGYTTSKASASATSATSVPTAGAGKVAALSGAALAGVVGLAAFL